MFLESEVDDPLPSARTAFSASGGFEDDEPPSRPRRHPQRILANETAENGMIVPRPVVIQAGAVVFPGRIRAFP